MGKVLSVSSNITTAEAYTAKYELLDVALRFDDEEGSTLLTSNQFALYQNEPNPFKSETVIGFNLPQAESATLKIYDVSGRVLKVVEGDFAKGYNHVTFDRSELGASGVLYYQLDTEDNTATRKMILID